MKWYQDVGKTINLYGITIGNLGEWYVVNWICVVMNACILLGCILEHACSYHVAHLDFGLMYLMSCISGNK